MLTGRPEKRQNHLEQVRVTSMYVHNCISCVQELGVKYAVLCTTRRELTN